jgi:hypothetical protein
MFLNRRFRLDRTVLNQNRYDKLDTPKKVKENVKHNGVSCKNI